MKPIKSIMDQASQKAFTVVELVIATAVFSVVLILSLTGFLQIGQMFYKGVNITTTTNTAKQLINSLKSDVAFDSDTASITKFTSPTINTPIGPVTRQWFCAGSHRYSLILQRRQVDREAVANEMKNFPVDGWHRFGLLKDQVSVAFSCPNPFTSPVGAGKIDPNNVIELIGDKMRLSRLDILRIPDTSLYTLDVHIAYGNDDVLDAPDSPNTKCRSGAANSRYCFVTDIRTTARRGFLP